jgi:hypothetical protein
LGTAEDKIEQRLLYFFALAELWGAVLLLDEADIFLEQRATRDLQRNGLVSGMLAFHLVILSSERLPADTLNIVAFLRRAEYFNGMLFLTTNRVGQIDDAFISRIQVPIRFKPLSGPYLLRIWENFCTKLKDDQAKVEQKNRSLPPEEAHAKVPVITIDHSAKNAIWRRFATDVEPRLNGRDIRNALQTAITLAEYDFYESKGKHEIVVTEKHFTSVLNMSLEFRDYIDENAMGQDEAARAFKRKDRRDRPSAKSQEGSKKDK